MQHALDACHTGTFTLKEDDHLRSTEYLGTTSTDTTVKFSSPLEALHDAVCNPISNALHQPPEVKTLRIQIIDRDLALWRVLRRRR